MQVSSFLSLQNSAGGVHTQANGTCSQTESMLTSSVNKLADLESEYSLLTFGTEYRTDEIPKSHHVGC